MKRRGWAALLAAVLLMGTAGCGRVRRPQGDPTGSAQTGSESTQTGSESTLYLLDVTFKDASGELISADAAAEFQAVDTGEDRSNLFGIAGAITVDGLAGNETANKEELKAANFDVQNYCLSHSGVELWDKLGVDMDLESIVLGESTPAQFQTTYAQEVQAALDAMF